MSSEVTKLGVLLDATAQRDAVHVAVAPVVAGEKLYPGDHVAMFPEGHAIRPTEVRKAIGIVDPFLPFAVLKDERFWLFLYPQTITSLRHQWAHPAFGNVSSSPVGSDVDRSTEWLHNFLAGADCPGYDEVMKLIESGGKIGAGYNRSEIDDEYMFFGGQDAHGEIPDEFWHHVEVVTGKSKSYALDTFLVVASIAWCWLVRRHAAAMPTWNDGGEVYLRCPDCGARSRGWKVV